MRDDDDDERTVKIELLSRWKLEAEFRNIEISYKTERLLATC